jgi:small subunit ribosomal protein S8
MSLNDPIANALSLIDNCEKIGRTTAEIRPASKITKKILEVMKNNGYLESIKETEDGKGNALTVTMKGTINRCGVIKPRYPITKNEFEKFERRYLPAKGFGIIIMSTQKGIITHEEAKSQGIGGRLIAYCY